MSEQPERGTGRDTDQDTGRDTDQDTGRDTDQDTGRDTDQDTGHEASVNQQRHEPTPASHHADQDQQAPATSEQHSAAARGTQAPGPVVHGDAVRDMMGGPPPQGDVPDAPGTQIAATDSPDPAATDPANAGQRVRHVANAVPGKPDGEVDTRS